MSIVTANSQDIIEAQPGALIGPTGENVHVRYMPSANDERFENFPVLIVLITGEPSLGLAGFSLN